MTRRAGESRLGPRDPALTSQMMARVRGKDSKAEWALRRALHARGFRYRLHANDVPGRPDIVVRARRIAVFVDGDVWHGNADEVRRRGRASIAELFPTRTRWWVEKIERNVARDLEVNEQLQAAGWTVIRLWEHDILADPGAAAERVLRHLADLDSRRRPGAWREGRVDPRVWRAPDGGNARQRAKEQDRAAGGRAARLITLADGRSALASVLLRQPSAARRLYAYLRWTTEAKTCERYLGEVDQPTRTANLTAAWRIARERGMAATPVTRGHGDSPVGKTAAKI